MADIERLRRHHSEIISIVRKMATYESDQIIMENALALSMSVGVLTGVLGMHLLAEDKLLYPGLLVHNDETVRAISKRYSDETGELSRMILEYKRKYSKAIMIYNDPTAFRRETTAVGSVLCARIEAENDVLYPFIQR